MFNSCGQNWKYFYILGGFLIHLSIGFFYSFGHIKPKIDKFLKSENFTGNISSDWIFGLTLFGMGSAMSLGGYVEMKIGSSLTVILGGWLMSVNTCLMSFVLPTKKLLIIILTYGLFAGFGTGLAYGVALSVPLKITKAYRGLLFGIVVSGFGISASVFDFVQQQLIGKDSEENKSIPMSFLYMGIIYASLQLIGGILMKKKSNEIVHSDDSTEPPINIFENSFYLENTSEFKPHEIIFELDFWVLWIVMFLNTISVTLITSLYSVYCKPCTIDTKLIYISTTGAVFNCLGRIFWGFIINQKPFKMTMLIITVFTAILMAIFSFIPNMKPENPFLCIGFGMLFCAINFFQSGNFSIFPFICAELFGTKYFVCNYGMIFTACSVAGIIVNMVVTSFSSYSILFISGAALSILSALSTLIYRGKSLIIRNNQSMF